MIRNLTNISAAEVALDDFKGKVVAVGETFDGLMFGDTVLKDSEFIAHALIEHKLTLTDGIATYSGLDALYVIMDVARQFTVDGKPITTSSDRPKDTYRCFTGRGDNAHIGEGADLLFDVAPGSSQSIDIKFLDNVFIKDGTIVYQNAELGTHLDIEVIAMPNVPFPHPTHEGTLDLVDGAFVANATNTGVYMSAPIEVKLFSFMNHMHLLGDDQQRVDSPESFQLHSLYTLRCTLVHVAGAAQNLKAAVTIGMYRARTL